MAVWGQLLREHFRSPSPLGVSGLSDLPKSPAYGFGRTLPAVRSAYPPASPLLSSGHGWGRNFNRLSIAYAFRPGLRSRLTLRGRAFLRNPWVFGGEDSHLSFCYSYRHSHFPSVHLSLQSSFYPMGTLPYPYWRLDVGCWKLDLLELTPSLDHFAFPSNF